MFDNVGPSKTELDKDRHSRTKVEECGQSWRKIQKLTKMDKNGQSQTNIDKVGQKWTKSNKNETKMNKGGQK